MFFFNFFYEFSTVPICTGFLVRNKEGVVMHGRNLDFEMWELISKMLVTIDYYRDGQLLYSSDSVAATVFALTGIKPGHFSINVDTRYTRHFQDNLISVIKDNAIPTCWLLRKVFEEETSYAAASQRLRSETISAPVYFIIAGLGPNEGMVIERDTNATHAFYQLSDETWFLVQTNYDRDQPEPVYDQRRIPMEHRVQKRGQNFTHETVLEEMFTWPNFNIATIMTAVMVPGQKYKNVTAWYGLNPSEKQLSAE
jgi:N-acylethanolamine-hydrolysing acid amidase